MKYIRNLWLIIIFVLVLPSAAEAQEDMSVEEELDSTYTAIEDHMQLFQ